MILQQDFEKKGPFHCLLCDEIPAIGTTSYDFHKHLCEAHFRERLIAAIPVTETPREPAAPGVDPNLNPENTSTGMVKKYGCPFPDCDYSLPQKWVMAKHYGLKHQIAKKLFAVICNLENIPTEILQYQVQHTRIANASIEAARAKEAARLAEIAKEEEAQRAEEAAKLAQESAKLAEAQKAADFAKAVQVLQESGSASFDAAKAMQALQSSESANFGARAMQALQQSAEVANFANPVANFANPVAKTVQALPASSQPVVNFARQSVVPTMQAPNFSGKIGQSLPPSQANLPSSQINLPPTQINLPPTQVNLPPTQVSNTIHSSARFSEHGVKADEIAARMAELTKIAAGKSMVDNDHEQDDLDDTFDDSSFDEMEAIARIDPNAGQAMMAQQQLTQHEPQQYFKQQSQIHSGTNNVHPAPSSIPQAQYQSQTPQLAQDLSRQVVNDQEPSQMIEHLNNQQNYDCQICSAKYRGFSEYSKHLSKVHFKHKLLSMVPKSPPYKCPWKGCEVVKKDR